MITGYCLQNIILPGLSYGAPGTPAQRVVSRDLSIVAAPLASASGPVHSLPKPEKADEPFPDEILPDSLQEDAAEKLACEDDCAGPEEGADRNGPTLESLFGFCPRPDIVAPAEDSLEGLVWIDLLDPAPVEISRVEEMAGLRLPSRADMQEIETSSRFYQEGKARYMTINLVYKGDTDRPEAPPVTLILTPEFLITLRHDDPIPFRRFAEKMLAHPEHARSAELAFFGLLETITGRIADLLERASGLLDQAAADVFDRAAHDPSGKPSPIRPPDLRTSLRRVGLAGELNSRARQSLLSMDRLMAFLVLTGDTKQSKDLRMRMKTISRDVTSLTEHVEFLSGRVNFLLDAVLGMLSIEQNAIIKIFSVATVIFLPPTLIASIYGMNFKLMPELNWMFGYPMAIGMMLTSAFIFYRYFKRRGWL